MASNVSYGASMYATRAINTTARAPAPRPGTATRRVTSMAGTGKVRGMAIGEVGGLFRRSVVTLLYRSGLFDVHMSVCEHCIVII